MIELVYPTEPARVEKGGKGAHSAEMLPIVEPDGEVTAQASRAYCHGPRKPLHPVVHLEIINRSGAIYLQKRSAEKKLFPNRWDTAVGGHVSYGEYVHEALYRESWEELGFRDFNPKFLDNYISETDTERELVSLFAAVGDFELHPDHDEVTDGRWWSIREIEANIGKGIFTPLFEKEYIRYKDALLALL